MLPPWLRGARAAVVFLTRLPVGGFPYSPADWRWACAWFPAVGTGLGVVYAAAYLATAPLGPEVAAALVVTTSLLVTGAFHEDGLADSCDAIGGGYTRERVLEILKDSRIGAYGAAGLVMVLLLRVLLLARLGSVAPVALVFGETAARLAPLYLMRAMPYATADGAKSRDVARAATPQLLLGTVWTCAVIAALVATQLLSPLSVGAALAATVLVTVLAGRQFQRAVAGITGDFLGATEQVALLAILLALLAVRVT